MLKNLSRKTRFWLLGSMVLNIMFVLYFLASFFAGWFIDASGALDMAEYKGMQYRLCEERYQAILDDYDKNYPDRAEGLKNSFAINVCHRNYKTGEQLDLQPLVDQVK